MSTTDRVASHATSKPRMAIPAPGTGYRGSARGGSPQRRLDRLRQRLRSSEQVIAADALAHERGRIAADVHDLVMQDLALALAAARTLADDPNLRAAGTDGGRSQRAGSGRRSRSGRGSRRSRPSVGRRGRTWQRVHRREACSTDVRRRRGGRRRSTGSTDAGRAHSIGREAVTNAIKYADPDSIEVVLDHADEWRLRVSDHGRGFDAAAVHGGFGLQSMRRQAHALGGRLLVRSTPGLGTTVEAVLP